MSQLILLDVAPEPGGLVILGVGLLVVIVIILVLLAVIIVGIVMIVRSVRKNKRLQNPPNYPPPGQ